MRSFAIFVIFLVILMPAIATAQNPVSWALESDTRGNTVEASQTFKAALKATIEGDWYLYDMQQPPNGPFPTTITVSDPARFQIDGKITSGGVITKFDPNFKMETRIYDDRAEFSVPLKAVTAGGIGDLAVNVRYQVCNASVCLPPKTVRVSFAGFEDVKKASAPTQNQPVNSVEVKQAGRNVVPDGNIWTFFWLAVTLGALSLLTPCVFPMIPITVTYFTNHSSGSRSKAIRLASVYSLGIVATFTLLGMLLAVFVGAAGINLFAANPWINLLIAGIFLFFAFSLFGAYEINIPASVLTSLDRITRTREGEGSGVIGALLMGLTFTLTSFTCTSPFVGTILVSASQGDWQWPLLGMLAFSTVFALPFFVLALVPQWVARIPRAGGWMNSVKVSMGFLEVAAAMKFVSNVDLIWQWNIFTRGVVLAIWIAIGVILSIYLLGKFQLTNDSKPDRIGAFRLASAILSLSISFYLITGLFGAKLGELEAFLPPETEASAAGRMASAKDAEPAWIVNDYPAALVKAKAENKRVFIDFTGYTCTNCRWMEANIFTRPEVAAAMNKFVLARLYTDREGDVYERQQKMEQDMFGTVALPFYAVVDENGKPIVTFAGLTRNAAEFVDFLRSGAEK